MPVPASIRQLSPPGHAAIHSYFDICPESPDGTLVSWFRFTDKVPGPGRVVIAERSGKVIAEVPGEVHGASQVGVRHQWVGERQIAFNLDRGTTPRTQVFDLATGQTRELPGGLRMYSPAAKLGLTSAHDWRIARLTPPIENVSLMDFAQGTLRQLFTRDDVARCHPLRDSFACLEHMHFKHTKWAPDGSRFFTVFNNEQAFRAGERPRLKSLIVCQADGTGLRYFSEFGHHPLWAADSQAICCFNRRGQEQDLVAMPLDGSPARVLLRGVVGTHADIHPGQRWVAADALNWEGPGRSSLFLYDLATGERQTLHELDLPDTSQETGCHAHPVFSRDGRRVYFNDTHAGRPYLGVAELSA